MGASFSVVRVQLYGLVVVLYGPLILAQVTVGIAPVVVGRNVVRVQFYGLVVVLYGPLVLAQVTVGMTTVVVGPVSFGSRSIALS